MKHRIALVVLITLFSCTSSMPRARTTLPPRATPSPSISASSSRRPTLSHLPYVVERAAGAVIGDTGYMLGGLVPGDRSISTILSVDLETGTARRVASLPIAAHDAAAVAIGDKVWVFGGSDPAGTLVQQFDPATRKVITIGHLPRTLSDLAATTIGNTAYVAGGFDGTRARAEVLATTDGRSFKVVATLPHGLRYAALGAAGSKLIVAGGQTQTAGASRSVYAVDPESGSVRTIAQLPAAVAHAVVVVRGDSAFVVGGRDEAGRPTARVWRVTTSTGAVSAVDAIRQPLADLTLLVGPSRVVLAGGATGTSSSGGETNVEILFT